LTHTAGCIVRALTLSLACLAAAAGGPAGAQPSTFHGSTTVRVTDDAMKFGDFTLSRFPAFAEESLARHYKLGGKVKVVPGASADSMIEDLELRGPSRCLVPEISRGGWQKLRFEFSYKIEGRTREPHYIFEVRFVSGHVADYQQDREPPPERYQQIPPEKLIELANQLAGFMRREMSKPCFDRQNLTYCPGTVPEPCP
jgi:hypothetical protein